MITLFDRKRLARKALNWAFRHDPSLAAEIFHEQLGATVDALEPEPAIYEQNIRWHQTVVARQPQSALEVGTLQAVKGVSTHQRAFFPMVPMENYIRFDIEKDDDVDVVGDIHALPPEWTGKFDLFIANAVWEHLDRPWIAAKEVARVLSPNGIFTVGTHQTFPLHGYPHDFFRFSKEALRLLFEDAGLVVDDCSYRSRCLNIPQSTILPAQHAIDWNRQFPSYVHVIAYGHKPA
jgi:SAM-dependent methyltransferase